jgi:hypothetical protein
MKGRKCLEIGAFQVAAHGPVRSQAEDATGGKAGDYPAGVRLLGVYWQRRRMPPNAVCNSVRALLRRTFRPSATAGRGLSEIVTDRDLSPRPNRIHAQEFSRSFPPLSAYGTVLAVKGPLWPCLLARP